MRGKVMTALALAGLCAGPAMAQNNPFRDKPLVAPPASTPNIFPEKPVDPALAARLDALAAAEDWKGLREAVFPLNDPATIVKATDWLKAKTDNGGSFIIPFLYARNLWLFTEAARLAKQEVPDIEGVRNQAALMSMYAVALVHMDGMACADPTAPSHWLTSLGQSEAGAALRYWRDQPAEIKEYTVRIAVGLEAVTARRRKAEDPLVCSGGMDELGAGMAAGTVSEGHVEPGHIGRVHDVKPPPGWKPSFLPASEYLAKQDKERGAGLYDYLYPAEKEPDAETLAAAGRMSDTPVAPAGVQDDPTVKLALAALPAPPNPESLNIILRYTMVAKSWWLETRCHIVEPSKAAGFANDVAVNTRAMRFSLQKMFGIPESKAEEYVEKIQMYQLEGLSAAKFYGCGPEAKNAFAPGFAETQRIMGRPQ